MDSLFLEYLKATAPCQESFSPVALPCVANIHVIDAVSVGLLIQEVKHVFDGEGQGRAPAHGAEQSLKQVIHKLLQRALYKTAPCESGLLSLFSLF